MQRVAFVVRGSVYSPALKSAVNLEKPVLMDNVLMCHAEVKSVKMVKSVMESVV